MTIGAVGADRWQVEIFGALRRAGRRTGRGISSTAILALALADVKAGGWFGRWWRQAAAPAMSVPSPAAAPAGDATNVVTDYVHVRGEAAATMRSSSRRSPRPTGGVRRRQSASRTATASQAASSSGRDRLLSVPHEGRPARGQARGRSGIGIATPVIRAANGGLDANWMVRHGVPTVTFGAGQNSRTIDEWINLDDHDRAYCARGATRDDAVSLRVICVAARDL